MSQKKVNLVPKLDMSEWSFPLEGTIYSFTTTRYPLPGYENPPYFVGLIELSNGVLITARILTEDGNNLEINQSVHVELENIPESENKPILIARIH